LHPALLKLIRLQVRGWLRRQFKGGSLRRTVFMILGGGAFLLWFASMALSAALSKSQPPEQIMATLPFYLTAFALLPIIVGNDDRAIAFSPAEIDFLFSGPFSRRQLVGYKMFKLVLGSVLGGLLFSLWLNRIVGFFPTAVVGASLSLVFINLLTTIASLLRDIVQERSFTLIRRGATFLFLGGIVAIVMYLRSHNLSGFEGMEKLSSRPLVQILLAPARVFAHVFASRSPGEFAMWASGSLAMIIAAAGGVFALDKGYMEAAVNASQRRALRLTRATKGMSINTGKPMKAVNIPGVAALGPGGAIVKRQLLTAMRGSRGWIFAFVFAIGYGYLMSRMAGGMHGNAGTVALIPGLAILLMMLPQTLRFDFRSDLDHLDWLKTLPMTAMTVALAELTVPTFILSLLGLLIAGVSSTFLDLPPSTLVMIILAVPPAGLIIIALENIVFLLLPTRLFAPGQASMVFSGRRILMMLFRLALMVVGGGLVFGTGALVWYLTHSVPATYASGWLVLSLIAAALIKAVAWGFSRFDVSLDMPV